MAVSENLINLSGRIVSDFEFSSEVYGEKFYTVFVSCIRKSGTEDRLPVIISERLLKPDNCNSSFISVQGEIRSYDKWLKEKSRLKVYVFATYATIKDTPDEENKNSVVLTGHICRKPTYRLVDNKKEISDFIISVKRKYNKSDYIPCVCWGRTAKCVFGLDVGTEITITGRFQSRDYIKSIDGKDVTRTTYEVSASNIKVV